MHLRTFAELDSGVSVDGLRKFKREAEEEHVRDGWTFLALQPTRLSRDLVPERPH